ncbi:hypothetical protein ACE6H2_016728 [Prunus campanulata]
MDPSIAQMTCVLKVNIKCEACRTKIYDVLQNIYGVYKIDIDAEKETVKVAELKSLTFDVEVRDNYDYFGQGGYGYGYGHGHGHGCNPYAVPAYHPCPPFGGFDHYDPSRLIMVPLSLSLPLPSPSSVPQQSQPLQLQSQSQSVPPQPPALPLVLL